MTENPHFEKLICDADTWLLRAAKVVEQNYVIVRNKKTGVEKRFKNQTEFWGHHKKKEGGWLADTVDFLNVPAWVKPEHFEIEECVELNPDITDHLKEAEKHFDFAVGRAKKLVDADDYLLLIGGVGNFRYECAKRQPYKGERKAKPLVFAELKELITTKYKNKIELCNGIEADDQAGIYAWQNYQNYLKTKQWKYCFSYIDKDLNMLISPSVNPDKPEQGIHYQTPLEAARCFASQCLTGDRTDHIAGVGKIGEEFYQDLNLKCRSGGVGKATALQILEDCTTPKQMFERVIAAYKNSFGTEPHAFTTHTGEEIEWTWIDYLQDSARLLWMMRTPEDVYDIRVTLDRLGVDYK